MNTPEVSDISEQNNSLTCKFDKINVSIINAIRRTILSDIPILVFRTTPYEENQANIITNTSRFNNEIIKQRLSCIPIHINDLSIPYNNYEVIINVSNDSSQTINVTTSDFKIKDITNDTFIDKNEVKKIFPPNKITNDYIQFLRLRPKLSENLPGESINISAKMSIGTAKENGMFNAVYICSFSNRQDPVKIEEEWNKKQTELKSSGMNDTDILEYKTNWLILDAQRYYIEDAFEFTIKSVGIYTPTFLITKACDIINNQLNEISQGKGFNVDVNTNNTMINCFDIVFADEDYTIGKVLEYILYTNYYINTSVINYVSFYKSHPHNLEGILRVAFRNEVETNAVIQFLTTACTEGIQIFESIKNQF